MLRNSMLDFQKAQDDAAQAAAKIVIEPWMKEFVRGRHIQKEWDAFFRYCQAGPWKRRLIWLETTVARILGLRLPGFSD